MMQLYKSGSATLWLWIFCLLHCELNHSVKALHDTDQIVEVTCAGSIHLFSGSLFEVNLNVQTIRDAINEYGDAILIRAQCACPNTLRDELIRRFVPGVQSLLALLSHVPNPNDAGKYIFETEFLGLEKSCNDGTAGEATFSLFTDGLNSIQNINFGFEFPATCTYKSLRDGESCKFSVTGNAGHQYLKSSEDQMDVVLNTCESQSMWPYIAINCTGPSCDSLFVPQCNSDADCNLSADFKDNAQDSCLDFWSENSLDLDTSFTAIFDDIDLSTTPNDVTPENDLGNSTCESGMIDLQRVFGIMIGRYKIDTPEVVYPKSIKTCSWATFESRLSHLNDLVDAIKDSFSNELNLTKFLDDGYVYVLEPFLLFLGSIIPTSQVVLSSKLVTEFPSWDGLVAADDSLEGFKLRTCLLLGCHPSDIGDGVCHPQCNIEDCLFDGNDCRGCTCLEESNNDPTQCTQQGQNGLRDSFFQPTDIGTASMPINYDFPGLYFHASREYPSTCSQRSIDEPFVDRWVYDSSTCSVDPAQSATPSYFCTIDGLPPQENSLLINADSQELLECGNNIARVRDCFCLFGQLPASCPVPIFSAFDVSTEDYENFPLFSLLNANLIGSGCTFSTAHEDRLEVLSEEDYTLPNAVSFVHRRVSCPVYRYETYVKEENLNEYSGGSHDQNREEELYPDSSYVEPGTVLFSSCDGIAGISLFENAAFVGLSAPRVSDLLMLGAQVGGILEECEAIVDEFPWRGERILQEISNGFGFLSIPIIDIALFSQQGSVSYLMDSFSELFGVDTFSLGLTVQRCPDRDFMLADVLGINLLSFSTTINGLNELSELYFAIDSPELAAIFGTSKSSESCSQCDASEGFSCRDWYTDLDDVFEFDELLADIERHMLGWWVWMYGDEPDICKGENNFESAKFFRHLFSTIVVRDPSFDIELFSLGKQTLDIFEICSPLYSDLTITNAASWWDQQVDENNILLNVQPTDSENIPGTNPPTEAPSDTMPPSTLLSEKPPPQVLSAQFEDNFEIIYVDFDVDTTAATGVAVPTTAGFFACSSVLTISGSEPASLLCKWANPSTLTISVPTDFAFGIGDLVAFASGNNIRSSEGISEEVVGNVAIALKGNFELTQISGTVSVPSTVKICSNTLTASLDIVDGTLNKAVVIQSVKLWQVGESSSSDTVVRSLNFTETTNLVFIFNDLNGLPYDRDYYVEIEVRNWYEFENGMGATPLRSGIVRFENDQRPILTINNLLPDSELFRLPDYKPLSSSSVLRVSCTAKFLCENLIGSTATYQWKITGGEYSQGTRDPEHVFSLADISDRIGVDGTVISVRMSYGSSDTEEFSASISILSVDTVVIIYGGSNRIFYEGNDIILDGSKSCNPLVTEKCDLNFGYTGAGTPSIDLFNDVRFVCRDSLGLLVFSESTVVATFSGDQLAIGMYTCTLTIDGVSSSVDFEVVEAPTRLSECAVVPVVLINPVPSTVVMTDSGTLTLNGAISNYSGAIGITLMWEQIVCDLTNSNCSAIDVKDLISDNAKSNRESLVLQLVKMAFGQYTFRLTAKQNCTEGGHPFGETSFVFLSQPTVGSVLVDRMVGFAYLDTFTFKAANIHSDNTPLSFRFEYSFVKPEPGEIVSAADTFPLTGYISSSSLSTSLELPPLLEGEESAPVYVFAVAKDSLDSTSDRVNFVTVEVFAPIIDAWTPPNVTAEILEVENSGASPKDVLRKVTGLASFTNVARTEDEAAWSQSAKTEILSTIKTIDEQYVENPDTELLVLQVNVLETLVSNTDQVDDALGNDVSDFAQHLIEDAIESVESVQASEYDATAIETIPGSFFWGMLGTLSNVMSAADRSISEQYSPEQRKTFQSYTVANKVKDSVYDLAKLVSSGILPGADSRLLSSPAIQIAVGKDRRSLVGTNNGIAELVFPFPKYRKGASCSSTPQRAPGSFRFSPELLSTDENTGESASILGSAFNSVQAGIWGGSTSFNYFNENNSDCASIDLNKNYSGPLSSVTDVLSLNFLDPNGERVFLNSSSVQDGTVIIMVPFNNAIEEEDVCNQEDQTVVACGFYNETSDSWGTNGCRVASINFVDKQVVCECNHTTDYSAWRAFSEDIRKIFTTPYESVTRFALGILLSVVISVTVFWMLSIVWAIKKDWNQSKVLQKGAVSIALIRRLRRTYQLRRFFNDLRNIPDDKEKLRAASFDFKAEPLIKKKKKRRNIIHNFWIAIKYEHSLLSLVSRYDPMYSRLERMCVFVANVLGNLVSTAFFFELKTADDLTFWFIAGTIALSSLFVAVPVRIMIKTFFRSSKTRNMSEGEKVSNLYRIASQFYETELSRADSQRLLSAYCNLSAAEHQVNHYLKLKYEHQTRIQRLFNKVVDACKTSFGSQNTLSDARVGDIVEGDNNSSNDAEILIPQSEDENITELNSKELNETEEGLRISMQVLNMEKESFSNLLREFRIRFGSSHTEEAIERMNNIRSQDTTAMRFGALLSSEASVHALNRRPCCRNWCKYVGFVIFFGFLAFSVYYLTAFILSRIDRVQGDYAAEEEVLMIWLTSAALSVGVGYLAAEPLVLFMRYSFLPWCVHTFGRDSSHVSAYDSAKILTGEDQGAGNEAMITFWELASDFLESGI